MHGLERESTDVVVIGGGVAGAAAARALRRRGLATVVLEAADEVGGRTRTVRRPGFEDFVVDVGAIFVMGSYARTIELIAETGHASDMRRWEARTAVLDEHGAKHPVRFDRPWTLAGLPHLGWADRLRLARRIGRMALGTRLGPFELDDLAAADDGRTLAAWARDVLGERGFEYVLRPLMEPLTGADPEVISAAFARALMSQVHRTQLTVPVDGVGSIARWLLEGHGDVRTGTAATGVVETADGVLVSAGDGEIAAGAAIVATDLITARDLVRDVAPTEVAAALERAAPIAAHHVVLAYRSDPWPDVAHDLVVHAGRGRHPDYGVLLEGRRNPASVPDGGQMVSVWFDFEQAPAGPEDAVVDVARRAVAAAFGPAEPDAVEVFTWDAALMSPVPGHYAAMRAARDAMPARVRLAGDFLTHSGIEGAVLGGERAAHDLRHVLPTRSAVAFTPGRTAVSAT